MHGHRFADCRFRARFRAGFRAAEAAAAGAGARRRRPPVERSEVAGWFAGPAARRLVHRRRSS